LKVIEPFDLLAVSNCQVPPGAIVLVDVALVTNPYIYSTILSKVPENISLLLDNYNYFIKLILIFIILYLLIFYKCV
jgi:hypothetical protein